MCVCVCKHTYMHARTTISVARVLSFEKFFKAAAANRIHVFVSSAVKSGGGAPHLHSVPVCMYVCMCACVYVIVDKFLSHLL